MDDSKGLSGVNKPVALCFRYVYGWQNLTHRPKEEPTLTHEGKKRFVLFCPHQLVSATSSQTQSTVRCTISCRSYVYSLTALSSLKDQGYRLIDSGLPVTSVVLVKPSSLLQIVLFLNAKCVCFAGRGELKWESIQNRKLPQVFHTLVQNEQVVNIDMNYFNSLHDRSGLA